MLANQFGSSSLRLANSIAVPVPVVRRGRQIQTQAEESSSSSQQATAAAAPRVAPPKAPAAPPPSTPDAQPADMSQRGVTVEFQRAKAKEMVKFFRDQKQASINDKKLVLGWTLPNEINNGRWVMIGFSVGLLTEFATGVDFIEQLKLIVSYLGLLDLE